MFYLICLYFPIFTFHRVLQIHRQKFVHLLWLRDKYLRKQKCMILAQQFPSLWRNKSLIADLYVLSLHGLSEHESQGDMYCQLTTDFLSLDRHQNVSILHFFSNPCQKKWKYYITDRLRLTFTVFMKVCSLINFYFLRI